MTKWSCERALWNWVNMRTKKKHEYRKWLEGKEDRVWRCAKTLMESIWFSVEGRCILTFCYPCPISAQCRPARGYRASSSMSPPIDSKSFCFWRHHRLQPTTKLTECCGEGGEHSSERFTQNLKILTSGRDFHLENCLTFSFVFSRFPNNHSFSYLTQRRRRILTKSHNNKRPLRFSYKNWLRSGKQSHFHEKQEIINIA